MRRIRQLLLGLLGVLLLASGCSCSSKPEVVYTGPPIQPTHEAVLVAILYELNHTDLRIKMRIADGKIADSKILLQGWHVPDDMAEPLANAIEAANRDKDPQFPEQVAGSFRVTRQAGDRPVRIANGSSYDLPSSHASQIAKLLRVAPGLHTRLLDASTLESAKAIHRHAPAASSAELPAHLNIKITTRIGVVTNLQKPLFGWGTKTPRDCELRLECVATREKTTVNVVIDSSNGVVFAVEGWHKVAELVDQCAETVRKNETNVQSEVHNVVIGASEMNNRKIVGVRQSGRWFGYHLEMTADDAAEFARLVRLAPGLAKWMLTAFPLDKIARGD